MPAFHTSKLAGPAFVPWRTAALIAAGPNEISGVVGGWLAPGVPPAALLARQFTGSFA